MSGKILEQKIPTLVILWATLAFQHKILKVSIKWLPQETKSTIKRWSWEGEPATKSQEVRLFLTLSLQHFRQMV